MSFWKKSNETPLRSEEYERISKRFVELVAVVEELQTKFKILETNYNNLRGNFNRKLSGIKEEPKVEETENNIKPNIFLNPDGKPI